MIESILEFLKSNYSHFLIEEEQRNSNIPHVFLKPEGIVPVLEALKTHEKFSLSYLNDLTAVDWLGKKKIRFEVLYLLRSPKNKHSQIQIRVPIDDGDSVPSIVSVFKGANWPEREVYDLFGIPFINHPNLERIVLPDNFVGYPLRKDYPLEGPGQDYLIQDLLQIHIQDDISKED